MRLDLKVPIRVFTPKHFFLLIFLFLGRMNLFILMKFYIAEEVPLDETHLVVVRGLIHQKVSPKCVNEDSSTERRS